MGAGNPVERVRAALALPDDEAVGEMVAKHFIDRGFRNFAFCANSDTPALPADDPLRHWVERGFDLYGGLGRHPGLSPIFGLVSAPELDLAGLVPTTRAPDVDVRGKDGSHDRLWRIEDPTIIDAVTSAVGPHEVFIADGHHRYETALRYRVFGDLWAVRTLLLRKPSVPLIEHPDAYSFKVED